MRGHDLHLTIRADKVVDDIHVCDRKQKVRERVAEVERRGEKSARIPIISCASPQLSLTEYKPSTEMTQFVWGRGMFFRVFAILILWTFCPASAFAASITSQPYQGQKDILLLSGEIEEGDSEKVELLIQRSNSSGRIVYAIRLDSPGGNLLGGVRLARVIKVARLATSIRGGSTCASACFIAFAAGAEKFVHYTASVGVHGASNRHGEETTASGAATVSMARIVKVFGVPEAIIGKMVVTPPSQMVWLSPDELRSMGAKMVGKPDQLASPNAPLSLEQHSSTDATSQASAVPTWKGIVSMAFRVSVKQNGRARIARGCQPRLKVCNNAIFYKREDGTEVMVRTAEDLNGKTISRDVCSFNSFNDVRTCLNWDTGKITREMKSSEGVWTLVESE